MEKRRKEICSSDIHRYDDIIQLPHHVSEFHPRMAVSDRAAQFAPFAALTGYGAAIKETARLTEDMIDLDEDIRDTLDEKLLLIQERVSEQPTVTIVFFQPDGKKPGGAYGSVTGAVRKIDSYQRRLIMADGMSIPMEYIVELDIEAEEDA